MPSLSERMATLRESAKKEAESIAQEQDTAIEALRKRWDELLRAEQSAIEGSIRELSERAAAEMKEAASGMARAQRVVMWLWGRSAAVLLAWVVIVLLLGAGTIYLGRKTQSEWTRYSVVKEARELAAKEAAIITDEAGRRLARVDLSQYAKDETMRSQKQPGRIYILAENVNGGIYVRVAAR